MNKKILRAVSLATVSALLLTMLTACGTVKKKTEETGLTDVKDEMYSSAYWAAKYKKSDKELLSGDEILKYNASIVEGCADMADIMTYPAALTGTQLTRYISDWDIDAFRAMKLFDAAGVELNVPPVLDENGEVTEKGNTKLIDELAKNLALENVYDNNDVSYAIAACNTSLRKLPTEAEAYTEGDSVRDVFRIKSINIAEPMVVLHRSLDNKWCYVQTRETRGWIEWDRVILSEKGAWMNYVRADNFIVVTEPSITLTAKDNHSEPVTLYMGTILPLYNAAPEISNGQSTAGCYTAKVPTMDEFGNISFSEILIPKNAGVSLGWVEYTPANVLEIAFKLMGEKLNPDGINNGWDENSFYSTVFRCFGIFLPLTVAEQAIAPGTDIDLGLESLDGKKKQLDGVCPGTLLYSDESAFLYLGKNNGKYYILHPAKDFFVETARYTANCIILTSLDIIRADGATYLNSIENIKRLVPDTDKK